MTAIHIHRVATEVVGTVVGEPRWCFGCRKRRGGIYALHSPIEPGYYGPHWSYACDGCHRDCRLGFGWEWLDGTAGPRQSDGPYSATATSGRLHPRPPMEGMAICGVV